MGPSTPRSGPDVKREGRGPLVSPVNRLPPRFHCSVSAPRPDVQYQAVTTPGDPRRPGRTTAGDPRRPGRTTAVELIGFSRHGPLPTSLAVREAENLVEFRRIED